MAAVLHALQGILTIVIMIATGFYLSRKGWFSESFSAAVAQLVTKVCLPTYMIVNLTVNFSHDQLIEMSGGLPANCSGCSPARPPWPKSVNIFTAKG